MSDKPAQGEDDDAADASTPRRDMIVLGAQVAVGVGIAAAFWPFLAQMGPNRGSPRIDVTRVDLSAIAEGETRLVNWRGQPVFVRHRPFREIELARTITPQMRRDPLARNEMIDARALATEENRTLPGHAKWLVVGGSCTHLGCLIHSRSAAERIADGIGWQCPCHASRYDLSGRVVDGPAQANLPVPPYTISGNQLEIGAKRS